MPWLHKAQSATVVLLVIVAMTSLISETIPGVGAAVASAAIHRGTLNSIWSRCRSYAMHSSLKPLAKALCRHVFVALQLPPQSTEYVTSAREALKYRSVPGLMVVPLGSKSAERKLQEEAASDMEFLRFGK